MVCWRLPLSYTLTFRCHDFAEGLVHMVNRAAAERWSRRTAWALACALARAQATCTDMDTGNFQ